MHERAVFNFGKFKSRKCLISFSRDYVRKGEKNKKALKNQGFSWLYLFYSPYLAAGGILPALSSVRLIALPPQWSPRGARRLASSAPFRRYSPCANNSQLFAQGSPTPSGNPAVTEIQIRPLRRRRQPKQKGHRLVSFVLCCDS